MAETDERSKLEQRLYRQADAADMGWMTTGDFLRETAGALAECRRAMEITEVYRRLSEFEKTQGKGPHHDDVSQAIRAALARLKGGERRSLVPDSQPEHLPQTTEATAP